MSSANAVVPTYRVPTAFLTPQSGFRDASAKVGLKNNQKTAIAGQILWQGAAQQAQPQPFALAAGEERSYFMPVTGEQSFGKRAVARAEIRCEDGSVFGATAALSFAQAVSVSKPPTQDGSWKEWAAAPVIEFGHGDEVVSGSDIKDVYHGTSDILGWLRLLWDKDFLYLGVEAFDDHFVSVANRGRAGFSGDSIEFGVQPENILAAVAPYFEYELYLPDDGQNRCCASRRMPPTPADELITHWRATIKPTGVAGNVNYQVAIPWADLGLKAAAVGKTISLSVVLNDADIPGHFSGGRKRIHWFQGVDLQKNPEGYGDVTLVEAK